VNKAFVLGAGLGERLRPLTEQLPKPLIPVFHRPLITYAFDHLRGAGVNDFVVNTHHIPEAYALAFPDGRYGDARLRFRNESPVRLETAGGIANVRDLLGDEESFLVYNGDILTDLPLAPLIAEHESRGNIVTLGLRSRGPALHIAMDSAKGLVTDIRNKLGTGQEGSHLFTGIYAVSPAFYEWLTPGKVESVIPIFLKLIEQGHHVGAVVLDEGQWWDLGSRDAYIEAHRANLGHTSFGDTVAIHPDARVSPEATLRGANIIGPNAEVGAGARLEDCILWPHARVEPGAKLRRCIVRSGIAATGEHEHTDF
jgi:mannose-1-phosphate guanylyltransferase/mannose-1-phosphate guanylyltransferase/phosphomannomutase